MSEQPVNSFPFRFGHVITRPYRDRVVERPGLFHRASSLFFIRRECCMQDFRTPCCCAMTCRSTYDFYLDLLWVVFDIGGWIFGLDFHALWFVLMSYLMLCLGKLTFNVISKQEFLLWWGHRCTIAVVAVWPVCYAILIFHHSPCLGAIGLMYTNFFTLMLKKLFASEVNGPFSKILFCIFSLPGTSERFLVLFGHLVKSSIMSW